MDGFMGNLAALITAATALLALTGGYVQFILRRALHPCIEFDVEFLTLNHSASDQPVGEVLCRIKNEGPGVGYVTNVRCRVRYRLAGESEVREDEPNFAHRLPAEGFYFLDREKRFIQPGVTQWYRKPLVFPTNTCLITVWGAFEYELSVGWVTNFLASRYAVRHTFAVNLGG
jgi:hypothetical protein